MLCLFLSSKTTSLNPLKALCEPKVPLKSPCEEIFGVLFRYTEHFKCPVLNISGET